MIKKAFMVLGAGTWMVLAAGAYSAYSFLPKGDGCSQSSAELRVMTIVRNELIAPATASFGPRRVTRGKDCSFRFDGVVDAHNGFGALVRSRYVVTVQNVNGKWVRL